MTVAQYARHRGVSRQAVYKALGEGRIVRELDDTIDPDRADRLWAQNTNPFSRWSSGGEDVPLTDEDLERLVG
jgi:hypothetical protein